MAFGIEVKNSSGRTVFNTSQEYPNYYSPDAITNANGYNVDPGFSLGSGNILLARPQNGQSGAIFLTDKKAANTTADRFGGYDTYEQNFLAANGVRYFYIKPQDFSGTGAISSGGYGIEVYKSNGTDLLFSSNIGANVEIISFGSLSGNTSVTYTNTAYTFNDLYVSVNSFAGLDYNFQLAPQGTGTPDTHMVTGAWAYFNNSAGTIKITNASILSVFQVTAAMSNFNSGWAAKDHSARDYIIFRILS